MSQTGAGSFGAFNVANFRLLFVGTLASFTAFFTSTVVMSVVAFELTGTNTAVGSAVFGQGLGMLVSGPLGGAYADRLPKRRVIAVGQTLSATAFATLGLLYANEALRLVHLVGGAFTVGCAFGFIGPARQALVVDLVPDRLLGNAMALSNVANTISRVVGPFVAGILLAWALAGPAAAYGVMSILYLSSALLLLLLPRSIVRDDVKETHVIEDLTAGFRYAWGHVQLRHLVVFFVTVILIGFPHVTLLPSLLENELARPKEDVAVLAFCSAIGALATSLSLARFADSELATRLYSAMAVGFGATLMLLAVAPGFESAIVCMILVGATGGGFHALNGAVTARQTETPYMGRVMSLTLLAFAGFGLTALPLGVAADHFGERRVLFGMGAAVLLFSLAMSVVVVRDLRLPSRAPRR